VAYDTIADIDLIARNTGGKWGCGFRFADVKELKR
jgi:hypothetical protein